MSDEYEPVYVPNVSRSLDASEILPFRSVDREPDFDYEIRPLASIEYRKLQDGMRRGYFTWKTATPGEVHSVSSFTAGYNACLLFLEAKAKHNLEAARAQLGADNA